MKLTPACLLLACASLSSAQYAGSEPVPNLYKKGFDAIKIEDAKGFLTYLSGPECEGRGTVQPGFQKAAQFMAARFKEFGLTPVGNKGYFQIVHFARTTLRAKESKLETADEKSVFAGDGDIAFGALNRNCDISGPTVWLRIGKGDAALPTNVNLAGKIVIVVAPHFTNALRTKIMDADPMAIVGVSDTVIQAPGTAQRVVSLNLSRITITPAAAAKIAAQQGLPSSYADLSSVTETTDDGTANNGRLRLLAQFDEADPVDAMNVVGYLKGSDPKLNKELVGLGAHLDHLGKRGDVVYPGADDDGSGSTALLEIMKAYHEGGQRPRRSLLFMAFCGEEMGLLGSGFYSDHPIFPHDQMVAELQMDMVGRDSDGMQNGDRNRVDKKEENIDTMRLVGSKRISTDLHNQIIDDNKYIGFKFKWDAEDVYTRSDHYNFAKHGIPIAFLFDGFHPDYHRPTDTIEKIDWDKLTNAAKLYYMVSLDVANKTERPRKDVPQGGN